MYRKKAVIISYLVSIHVLLAVMLITSNFVPGVDRRLGISDRWNRLLSINSYGRSRQYVSGNKQHAIEWQNSLRNELCSILKIDDLILGDVVTPFNQKILKSETRSPAVQNTSLTEPSVSAYRFRELRINSTPKRQITIAVTTPTMLDRRFPAIVLVAGHGGTHLTCYESANGYYRIGQHLAELGYVTISTSVSQHEAADKERTLMGERLWDLMRCVDYLEAMPSVDVNRIGCAGKSLGGEMVMYLGALDERIKASVCAGFLTTMDHIEEYKGCTCWEFSGLRTLVDFSDIFALHASHPLLCQNGLKEPLSGFPVNIAQDASEEVAIIYENLEACDHFRLLIHEGGHEFDVPSVVEFFDVNLQ